MRHETKSKAKGEMELSTKLLLYFGFAWIIGGGLVACWFGLHQMEAGNFVYGLGTVCIGAVVLFSAVFMWRGLTRQ